MPSFFLFFALTFALITLLKSGEYFFFFDVDLCLACDFFLGLLGGLPVGLALNVKDIILRIAS